VSSLEKLLTNPSEKTYTLSECAVFCKVKGLFGALSNMHNGFPLLVGATPVLSTEALYQALRFPHAPEIQEEILLESNAYLAKKKAYQYLHKTRADWQKVNVSIMAFCLAVKTQQHFKAISHEFMLSASKPIVEQSSRDSFWGATPNSDFSLATGHNLLGRLWFRIRAASRQGLLKEYLELPLPGSLLLESPVAVSTTKPFTLGR
jgi:N-glycosidase YbiA